MHVTLVVTTLVYELGYLRGVVERPRGALSEAPSVKKGTQLGPLINVIGDRERPRSRYLNRLRDVAILQVVGSAKVYI